MKTRIRELRKSRGWTLQKVADMAGTTAQTVQRLETANMTVSMDWLERFAKVFSVPPSSLIRDNEKGQIPFFGALSSQGLLREASLNHSIAVSAVADRPVAIRLTDSLCGYRSGAIIIGNLLENKDMVGAHGLNSLVSLEDSSIILGKVIWQDSTIILAPISESLSVRVDISPKWVAPIVMEIVYF